MDSLLGWIRGILSDLKEVKENVKDGVENRIRKMVIEKVIVPTVLIMLVIFAIIILLVLTFFDIVPKQKTIKVKESQTKGFQIEA